ncbi:PIG-L family deacetylase [Anabaena sphaerica FACHB-251]|uniref:PIG-L family deacetylase n=1 Tax=Anabaena sphaerica FACHB-251 TaxID=2692883 RepID=A0A927A0T0_9NOST|nr:PIG-L deacetylase family protein [Anabaena sphaerica]MBD2292670.1 PIG-L family deacetylase [Anabaena sphaerica FACHB-251]
MLNVKQFCERVRNRILWLYNRKLPEFQQDFMSMSQFRWLVHIGSRPMEITQKSAMIISPHQDDEVLGCGGVIGLKREQDIPVQVVFMTDGAASHSWHPDFKSGEIVTVRRDEALTALSILGVDSSQIHFLDNPDSKLRFLNATERQKIIEKLAQLLQSFQPQEVYVPHRKDRTKDHEATYELVQEAIILSGIEVELLQYPIWILWHSRLFRDLQLQELSNAYRLSIHPLIDKKKQAIAAYRSQYTPIDMHSSPILKSAFLKRFFLPYEIFFKSDLPKNKH